MDIEKIPRSFWYSLDFCMVTLTIAGIFIAFRASSISIDVLNTKISLTTAVSNTEWAATKLRDDVKQFEAEKQSFYAMKANTGPGTKTRSPASTAQGLQQVQPTATQMGTTKDYRLDDIFQKLEDAKTRIKQ